MANPVRMRRVITLQYRPGRHDGQRKSVRTGHGFHSRRAFWPTFQKGKVP
jgi:hypothetical protein